MSYKGRDQKACAHTFKKDGSKRTHFIPCIIYQERKEREKWGCSCFNIKDLLYFLVLLKKRETRAKENLMMMESVFMSIRVRMGDFDLDINSGGSVSVTTAHTDDTRNPHKRDFCSTNAKRDLNKSMTFIFIVQIWARSEKTACKLDCACKHLDTNQCVWQLWCV